MVAHKVETSRQFNIDIPEKPSKDYFCFNCTGVADDGTNEPSKDRTNHSKLVVYRQYKLTALQIAQAFKFADAIEILSPFSEKNNASKPLPLFASRAKETYVMGSAASR
jgi:hypothetical protein